MKKIILLCFIFIAAVSFTGIAEPEKDILGNWRLDDGSVKSFITYQIEMTRVKSPEQAAQMEENPEALMQIIPNLVWTYKADNKLELQSPQGTQEATWKLSDDKKTHIVVRPDGTERKDIILELNKDRFKVLMGERKDTILFVRP
jgi:hypothetical protein